jgi:hypothetical protein
MPEFKINCPDCGATLKSSNPMPAGKKVKCPKCGKGFEVRAEDDEENPRPKKPAGKASPAAKKPPPPASAPAAPKDDEDVGTYAVIKEPEPENLDDEDEDEDEDDEDGEDGKKKKKSKKIDITFSLDTSIKDPRGPAQEAVVRPSNWLVLLGGLDVIFYVATIIWAVFPFLFAEHYISLDPIFGVSAKADEMVHIPDEASWTADQRAKVADADDNSWDIAKLGLGKFPRIWVMSVTIVFIAIGSVAVFGSVKMQTLESWGWGLAGTLLTPVASIPMFALTVVLVSTLFATDDLIVLIIMGGIGAAFAVFSGAVLFWTVQSLKVLLDPKVKEGYRHEAKEAKKRF